MSGAASLRERPRRSVLAAFLAASVLFAGCSSTGATDTPDATIDLSQFGAFPTEAPLAPEPTPPPVLRISKTSLTARVRPGGTASVAIRTAGGAICSIEVLYDSGPSIAAGLTTKKASASGAVRWSWRVGGRTNPGSDPIIIACSKGQSRGELDLSFAVT